MTQLYRIKPLEWEDSSPPQKNQPQKSEARGYEVYLAGYDFDAKKEMFVARDPWGWRICEEYFSTKEEAKSACEAHRRKLLEAELEPACQPATELPTGPGLYWFRLKGDSEWDSRRVIKQRGLQVYDELLESSYKPPIGQWIRIPEPEETP